MDQAKRSVVRTDPSLSEAERKHLARRRQTVLQCLKKLGISCREDKMPKIAVLGSGGGLRAMIGLLGSLSQLKEEGLLDCIMYLSGVSGSTWCMASLYKEADWSNKLRTVKDDIVQRLAKGRVSLSKRCEKMTSYYSRKDNFSMTDVFAALFVSNMVKEIDEHRISEHRGNYTRNPYPIYTVVDKQCKYDGLNTDVWFEITPDEAGHSLTGAFVDSSCLGSQFQNGKKSREQPETDMLYLQGLCGSAIADRLENRKWICETLQQMIQDKLHSAGQVNSVQNDRRLQNDEQVLLQLVELNLRMLRKEDPADCLRTIEALLKDKQDETERTAPMEMRMSERTAPMEMRMSERKISETELKDYILRVCRSITADSKLRGGFWMAAVKAIEKFASWDWGTTYNYLYQANVNGAHSSVIGSEKREYMDAGLLINSPYFSVLRKERDIDLIISLDFSAGNPFETVVKTAKTCKDLHIPFPEVVAPPENTDPQDFYVFKGSRNTPTVIHMPLFNAVNCNGEIQKWKEMYSTFQMSYSQEMITDLLEKAGANIKNNKGKLLNEIRNVIDKKNTYKLEI